MNKLGRTIMPEPIDQPSSAAPSQGLSPADKRWYAALAMVAAVALGLRLIYLWQLQHSPLAHLLVGDALGYYRWGQRIAAGDWVGKDVFYQAPLYPYFLGLIQTTLGESLLAIRLVQVLLGTAGCVLLAMVGNAMFGVGFGDGFGKRAGARAGLIAGLMLACYPAAIFFDGLIQKSALDLPLLCLSLWLLVMGRRAKSQPMQAASLTWWAAAGATLALLMLSRENALVFVAAAGLWALLPATDAAGGVVEQTSPTSEANDQANDQANDEQNKNAKTNACTNTNFLKRVNWRLGLLRSTALVFGLMLMLSPVIVRNKIIGGEFHLTTSQFGSNFYIGNHAGADGSYQPLRYGRGDVAYERTDAMELASERSGRKLGPGEVSSYWTGEVLSFMRNEPVMFAKLIGKKAMMMGNATEVTDTEGLYAYSDYASILRWFSFWHMGILFPLAAGGLVLGFSKHGKHSQDGNQGQRCVMLQAWLLPLSLGLYAASVIAFFVFARYRLPAVPLLMLIAASGLVSLPAVIRAGDKRKWVMGGLAVLVGVIIAWWPLLNVSDMRAVSYASFARAMDVRSIAAGAADATGTADNSSGAGGSSEAAKTNGSIAPKELESFYRKAITLAPQYAAAHYNYGVWLREQGRAAEAVQSLEAAVRVKPDLADAWNQLGLSQMQLGNARAAAGAYEQALRGRNDFAQAHNNLGVALVRLGLLERAVGHYQQAIAFDPAMAQAHNNLGTAMARLGDLPKAIVSFKAALAIDPNYADAKANLAKAQSLLEPAAGAAGELNEAAH